MTLASVNFFIDSENSNLLEKTKISFFYNWMYTEAMHLPRYAYSKIMKTVFLIFPNHTDVVTPLFHRKNREKGFIVYGLWFKGLRFTVYCLRVVW